VLVDVLQQKTV